MLENFQRSLAVTLPFEGGYVNHPDDPGGHTNKGITLTTLRAYKSGATVADLKAISADLVARIYRTGYWQPMNGDRLAAGVDLAAFDAAVNSGPGRARKWLAAAIGGSDADTVKKLCRQRLGFMQSLKIWKTFGKGWGRRVAAIEAKGVAWALAAAGKSPVVVREVLAKEQSTAQKTASKQNSGAGAAGTATGGGAVVAPEQADAIAGWIIGGLVVAGIVVVAVLLVRAAVNRQRAAAYAAEAADTARSEAEERVDG